MKYQVVIFVKIYFNFHPNDNNNVLQFDEDMANYILEWQRPNAVLVGVSVSINQFVVVLLLA